MPLAQLVLVTVQSIALNFATPVIAQAFGETEQALVQSCAAALCCPDISSIAVMASGSFVFLDRPWARKAVHGSGGRKSYWRHEEYKLSVTKSYQHWCGISYANLKLEHVVETAQTEDGNVTKSVTQLFGEQHWDADGRPDIRVTLPAPFGKVYLHVLAWWCFWNQDQFADWQEFRQTCLEHELDVDHGLQGHWRKQGTEWISRLNVHTLTLKTCFENRGQGEAVKAHYATRKRKR